jgi:hypothetical protein
MTPSERQPAATETAEKPAHISGKVRGRIPRRLKAKHLSLLTRAEIVRLFRAYESFDDVAQKVNLPGLTGRTVAEVLQASIMRMPPQPERGMSNQSNQPLLLRRAAA